MIIAASKDDTCIRRLWLILEKTYQQFTFKLSIGHTSRIEIDGEKLGKDDISIVEEIKIFCDGYTIGWEDSSDCE